MQEMSVLDRYTQIGNFGTLEQGIWGPAVKARNGVSGKSLEHIWLFDTYKALESI